MISHGFGHRRRAQPKEARGSTRPERSVALPWKRTAGRRPLPNAQRSLVLPGRDRPCLEPSPPYSRRAPRFADRVPSAPLVARSASLSATWAGVRRAAAGNVGHVSLLPEEARRTDEHAPPPATARRGVVLPRASPQLGASPPANRVSGLPHPVRTFAPASRSTPSASSCPPDHAAERFPAAGPYRSTPVPRRAGRADVVSRTVPPLRLGTSAFRVQQGHDLMGAQFTGTGPTTRSGVAPRSFRPVRALVRRSSPWLAPSTALIKSRIPTNAVWSRARCRPEGTPARDRRRPSSRPRHPAISEVRCIPGSTGSASELLAESIPSRRRHPPIMGCLYPEAQAGAPRPPRRSTRFASVPSATFSWGGPFSSLRSVALHPGRMFALYEGVEKLLHPKERGTRRSGPYSVLGPLDRARGLVVFTDTGAPARHCRQRGSQLGWSFPSDRRRAPKLPGRACSRTPAHLGGFCSSRLVGISLAEDPRNPALGRLGSTHRPACSGVHRRWCLLSRMKSPCRIARPSRRNVEVDPCSPPIPRRTRGVAGHIHLRTQHPGPDVRALTSAAKLEFTCRLDPRRSGWCRSTTVEGRGRRASPRWPIRAVSSFLTPTSNDPAAPTTKRCPNAGGGTRGRYPRSSGNPFNDAIQPSTTSTAVMVADDRQTASS